jgi:hypothetical protein
MNQLYTAAKQHKHTLFYLMLQECKVIVLMFYYQAIRRRKLSVTLSGFIIYFCTIIVY